MRIWPALEVGRLEPAPAYVETAFRRPDDDLLQAALVDHEVSAIEELADVWRVFFPTAAARDAAAASLRRSFPSLAIDAVDVADDDWGARSQASLKAVRVGDIVVAPPWDVPVIIVIQPSMGFGTGHHATTRLCLAALQALDVRGRRVLDVGTGSGVLAIAASLLGAAEVTGIDIDADAVHAARENLALNPAAHVTLAIAGVGVGSDPIPGATQGFDVVMANLTGSLLIQTAARLQDLGTTLVLSGFMPHEEPNVRAAYAALALTGRAEEDGWVCVTLLPR